MAEQETTPETQAPETQQETVKVEKTLSNDAINALILKKGSEEALKILKEAGLESTGNLKDDVAKFKAWKESQMSEAEKLKEQLSTKDLTETELKKEAEQAKFEAAAARLGVPDDKIDSFVKYAKVSEGETPLDKMKSYLSEIGFKAEKQTVTIGAKTKNEHLDKDTALLNKMYEINGIKI
jgi:hypothetical protein